MNIETILEEFAVVGRFPEAAVLASLEARPETVPAFLSILDRAGEPGKLDDRKEQAVFLIVHVLAELGEKRAYRPLLRLLGGDGERLEILLGDAITETLPQILIGLSDGDPAPLVALIENDDANEFVRDAAYSAWIYFVLDGAIDRDAAHTFLQTFETGPTRPEAGNFVWNGWAVAIALLGFDDLMPRVRQACDDDRIDLVFGDFDDYKDVFERARTKPPDQRMVDEGLYPFDDTIGRLRSWSGFQPAETADEPEDFDDFYDLDRLADLDLDGGALEPVVNPFRHVGRNDPCPCGSGKKFKKYCLTVTST
ncbi:MAG: DUF1186 domain-containing protein [Inquilinus sp.]|nr:DUF1186 domain-containing protein [Inquilinus sp.]